MFAYISRRVLLMIPTLLGILLISFAIIQFAPGGPVERIMAQLQGMDSGATGRFSGGGEAWSGACDTCTHKISRQKSLEREACTVVR